MTTSLRDLGERAGAVPVPQLDVSALVAAGESRIRRRRAVAVAAVTAVVVAVLSAAVLLAPGSRQAAPPPANNQSTNPDDGTVKTRQEARLLTYSVGPVIHWGDRAIDVREQTRGYGGVRHGLAYLDATDDGAVFVVGLVKPERDQSGKVTGLGFGAAAVWFTSGATPVRIGTTAGSAVRGFGIATSATGSTLAWKEPGDETTDLLQSPFGPVVVYDTATMSEVGRFGNAHAFPLGSVYDDVVFWVPDARRCQLTNSQFGPATWCRPGTPVMRFDVASGQQSQVGWADYEANRRSRPGLFTGPDHEIAGCTSCEVSPDGLYPSIMLVPRGGRLVLGGDFGFRIHALPAADRSSTVALTGDPVRFRVPARYLDSDEWRTSQWLSADRVVLAHHGLHSFDGPALFDCRLSTGDCRYVATLPDNVTTVAGENGGRG